jgi:hypothetical protein
MSTCADLIGTKYVYGSTDCIWLATTALQRMGIDRPDINPEWYKQKPRRWARDLLAWGYRISEPAYDGDIVLQFEPIGFSVIWNNGALYFCPLQKQVMWAPLDHFCRSYFHTSISSSQPLAFRKKSIGLYVQT